MADTGLRRTVDQNGESGTGGCSGNAGDRYAVALRNIGIVSGRRGFCLRAG